MSKIQEFAGNKDQQAAYAKWVNDPVTRMVLGVLHEKLFQDMTLTTIPGGQIPHAANVITEAFALHSQRHAGWGQCLAMLENLDEMVKPMPEMPPADYPTPDFSVANGGKQ